METHQAQEHQINRNSQPIPITTPLDGVCRLKGQPSGAELGPRPATSTMGMCLMQ